VSLLPLDQGVKGAVALITLPAKIETAVCADAGVPPTDKPPMCQYMTTTTTVPKP
jgi:hypothetical protein